MYRYQKITLIDITPAIKFVQASYTFVLIIDCRYNLAVFDLRCISSINFPLQKHLHPSIYFTSLMHHFTTGIATNML